MKVAVTALSLFVVMLLIVAPVNAEDEKPLAPGWLSLDGSVGLLDRGIADAKSSVEKALGINIGAYLDTGYNYSSNRPRSPRHISLRYFDQDHNRLVFNNFNITLEKPEQDWGVGFRVAGDFGRSAQLLREATFWRREPGDEPRAELREAFLTTTLPVGAGLQMKGGFFVTTLGTEILLNPGEYNDNISRSFLFNFSIPFRHLGVLFTYPVHRVVSVNAGVVTGWDNPGVTRDTPAFLGGLSLTPAENVTLASNIIVGKEPTIADSRRETTRLAWSNVLTAKPIDPLALSLEYTLGYQDRGSLDGTRNAVWQGVGGIAAYSWTDRFSTALRGEVFNDRDGARLAGEPFGTRTNVMVAEVTFTGSYSFTRMLLGRAEVRQDWSDRRVFRRGATRADREQTTFHLQLLYTF